MGKDRILSMKDLAPGRIRIPLGDEIDKLNIDVAPLMFLLDKVGKQGVKNMEFKWKQKERPNKYSATRPNADGGPVSGNWAAAAANDGVIHVPEDEAWMFAEGDIIQLPDEDAGGSKTTNIYVTGKGAAAGGYVPVNARVQDSGGTVDLSAYDPEGAGNSVNFQIFHLSNSFQLGTGKGSFKNYQPEEEYNYLQILQHPWGTLTTMEHTEYDVGGTELAENEETAEYLHETAKEKAAFFGRKHKELTGYMGLNYEQYFTGGLWEAVQTNATDIGGLLSESDFDDWVEESIKYAERPVIFAGDIVFKALKNWATDYLKIERSEKTWGLSMANYLTSFGSTVTLIPHREMLDKWYKGTAFCVDLNDMKYMYMEGLDTHVVKDIQPKDLKQKINEYRTWFGFKVGNEKRHGILSGVTGYA